MFIATKDTKVTAIHETEWQCRRKTKGMTKPEYWEWLATITSGDPPVVDYSGETGYTIVECTDEDVTARLVQLSDYTSIDGVYNIKYYASKRDSEIVDVEAHTIAAYTDEDGNDVAEEDVATTYVQSHFIGDDTAKDARLLAEQWTQIRAERNRLIAETDWMMLSDTGTVSAAWKNYRKALREIPQSQDSVKKFEDIDWPDKPSS